MSVVRTLAISLAVVALVSLCVTPAGGTQSRVPGPVSMGATDVRVVNEPPVRATQAGRWQVTLPPDTSVGISTGSSLALDAPDFVQRDRRYAVQWSGGSAGTYRVLEVRRGWGLVESDEGRLWINLAVAVSIREVR